MSNTVHLIVVGKLKDKNLEKIENDYLVRIKKPALKIHELKSNAENKEIEGKEILKKIKDISKDQSAQIVPLTEKGKQWDSPNFSKWLFKQLNHSQKSLIFIIAGAMGHSDEVLMLAQQQLSLSKLTFPHKIARILFIEQLYRAITIENNHPYHN